MPTRLLTEADLPVVRSLVEADPVANVFIGARLDAGVLQSLGVLHGWPTSDPQAVLHIGANLVPMAATLEPIPDFVATIGPHRTSQSIVGPSWLALALWRGLVDRWGRPWSRIRELRQRQPLMAISGSVRVPPDPRVRPIVAADFDSYFVASVAMYAEEVGVDPLARPESGYRSYCRWLVEAGRAFGIVQDGRVVFKADIGTVYGPVAQIQGVWLEPALRGRGLSVPAMAAVTEQVRAAHPTACLYVNDFNTPAIRCYQRVGYDQVGEFATVMY